MYSYLLELLAGQLTDWGLLIIDLDFPDLDASAEVILEADQVQQQQPVEPVPLRPISPPPVRKTRRNVFGERK